MIFKLRVIFFLICGCLYGLLLSAQPHGFVGDVTRGNLDVRSRNSVELLLSRPYHHIDSTSWKALITSNNSRPLLSFSALPFSVYSSYNSNLPYGRNDQALWQGRGLNISTTAGFALSFTKFVHFRVQPQFVRSQNRSFEAPFRLDGSTRSNISAYLYPRLSGLQIDNPWRFGDDPIQEFYWGNTFAAIDFGKIRFRFGYADNWWGASYFDNILFTNNAPSFLHSSIKTEAPIQTRIGSIEFQWLAGQIEGSDFFQTDETNNRNRFLTGILIGFKPRFLPNISVGFARVVYSYLPEQGLDGLDYLYLFAPLFKEKFYDAYPLGNDDKDQMISTFIRWNFPQSGAEIYGEFSRNDHAANWRDLLTQPGHSLAFSVGISKKSEVQLGTLNFVTEYTRLEQSKTFSIRPTPSFYRHSVVSHGYTNQGQILGAGIGAGGNSFTSMVTLKRNNTMFGLQFNHTTIDNDLTYWIASSRWPTSGSEKNWVQLNVSPSMEVEWNKCSLHLAYNLGWNLNSGFRIGNDVRNSSISTSFSYRF